jgi:hypothetical protein
MPHNLRREPLPRKPDPKVKRPEKRKKRVTVIAGFQCRDALLMCADSEQSLPGDSKSQIRKIDSFAAAGFRVAIGGAGDMDLIEHVQYQLKQAFNQNPPSREKVDAWMEGFARNIWDACVVPYSGLASAPPDADFIIGLQIGGENILYKWERDMIHPVPRTTHTSIGSGIIQSAPLLAALDPFYLPAHQMLLYAVRAMLRVKQLAQGCGGKTEAVLLMNDGFIIMPATREIDAIEYLVEEMDHFLLDSAVGFIAGHVNTNVDTDLSDHAEVLKRFKTNYEKTVPTLFSWYRQREN